ncbi:MAG: hypothetical protein IH600_04450 [Bacteroidetes bacterium]|nr:hypothetical protein [Bacteroidota bacterium]
MHELFDRNIRNSLLVTGGEFETALADIIDQLEHPPIIDGRHLAAWEIARMIAEAMGEGFAGLPPNGFDFACWLWETAPLHVVRIPHANSIGTAHGFRYGVAHLRKISAMLAGSYLQQQPQKAPQIIELIDMSLDWVDARNLILYALLEHYDLYFQQDYPILEELAISPKPWRRLITPGVAARIIGTRPADSASAFMLLRRSAEHVDDPHVYHALQYVLRIAGMYGSRSDLLDFLSSLRESTEPQLHELICDFLRNPRLQWDLDARRQVIDILHIWNTNAVQDARIPCLAQTLQKLQAESASV